MKQWEAYQKFLEKVDKGEKVTVVYFGGSITAGAGTEPRTGIGMDGQPYDESDYDPSLHSWRARSFAWLRENCEKYPGQITHINASIGGTGSLFGAIRANEHVLPHKPDFIFIEYAVNDNGVAPLTKENPAAEKSLYRSLTSIISRLRAQNPEIAIFIPLSTYRLGTSGNSNWTANMQLSADLTKIYCDTQEIPYVSIYDAYHKDPTVESARTYAGADTPGSTVHPSGYGHEMYARAVCKTLKGLFDGKPFPFGDKHCDISAITPFPNSPVFVTGDALQPCLSGEYHVEINGTEKMHTVFSGTKRFIYTGTDTVVRCTFNGTLAGAWFDFSSCGSLDIFIDGQKVGVWSHNTQIKGDFSDQYSIFAYDMAPGNHRLEIVPQKEQKPAEGKAFQIILRAVFTDK